MILGRKNDLYNKFLGFLIKKGKKNIAMKMLNSVFFDLSKKTGKSSCFLLFKIFKKLNVFVESKTLRIRRRIYTVPFSLTLKRRFYLIIKWLIDSAKTNKRKISFSKKISAEIFLVLKNSSLSKSLKLKALNNKNALKNRSNIHYRW